MRRPLRCCSLAVVLAVLAACELRIVEPATPLPTSGASQPSAPAIQPPSAPAQASAAPPPVTPRPAASATPPPATPAPPLASAPLPRPTPSPPAEGPRSPDWAVVRVAGRPGDHGYQDGPAEDARFDHPFGIAAAPDGVLWVTDSANHCVRRIDANGVVTTFAGTNASGFADGPAEAARFAAPVEAIARDAAGNLYVADNGNHRLRRISPEGLVTTLAGDGTYGDRDGAPGVGQLRRVRGLTVAPDGTLYVIDANRVRAVAPDGTLRTIAGGDDEGRADGPAEVARFAVPHGIVVTKDQHLIVADAMGPTLRRIAPDGRVSVLAGKPGVAGHRDGPAGQAMFGGPRGLVQDVAGTLFFADFVDAGGAVRRLDAQPEVVTLAAGAPLAQPIGLAFAGRVLYAVDQDAGAIFKLTPR